MYTKGSAERKRLCREEKKFMFRKKGFFVLCGIGLAAVAAILTGVVLIGQKKNGDAMTRYEWIKMLAERFGMEEYEEETPYFRDVV